MSKQSRRPSRPHNEPRSLPAAHGNAAVAQSQAPIAITQSKGEATILKILADTKVKRAMSVRLGRIMTPDTMIAMVSTCLRQTPLLAQCDPMTVMGAVLETAQVGLRLDRVLGQAYLVPFKNNRRGVYEAQLILGYRGMITMAEHAERVTAVRAKVVCEKDFFEYEEGLVPILKHKPFDGDDAGRWTHAYSVVHKRDELAIPYVLRWSKIRELKERQLSRGGGMSPWATHEDEMGMKTVIRRGLKYHPLAPRQQRIVNLDELGEEGIDQELGLVGEQAMDEIASSSESMVEAREQSAIEAATPGVVAQPEREEAKAHAQAPADPTGLSPAEQELFERDIAAREGDGER